MNDTETKPEVQAEMPVDWLPKNLRIIPFSERSQGIGGSDIAAVVGANPWKTPYDVWLQKTGKVDAIEETPAMEWGTRLQDAVLQKYATKNGIRVACPQVTLQVLDQPFMVATPDGYHVAAPAGVEVKTASNFATSEWGEPGTDEVPKHYLLQCIWSMAVCQAPVWYVPVLIGGSDYREYVVDRSDELEAILIEAAGEFWTKHVQADIPPEFQSSDTAAAYLKKRFPKDTGALRLATAEETALALKLKEAKALAESAKEAFESLKMQVQNLIGDASGIEGSFGKITWKSSKDREQPDWYMIAKELGSTQELESKHRMILPGSRRFLTNFK